jgi:hypothetical protein
MQKDQTTQDAKRLLAAMSTNHSEARVASPYGLDRPFSPSWADAEQAGLDRVRRDAAMWWLIENNVLEREEEELRTCGTKGREFRITITFTARCSASLILGGSCWRRSGRNEGSNKCSLRRSSSNKVGVSPTPLREGLRGGRTEAVVAQAHTEVTERCKKSAKSAQRRWPKN